MATPLEAIVRPFQAPTPLNTNIVVSRVDLVPASRARLRWGVVGELTPPSTFQVKNCNDKYKELKREVELIKIEDPDNPDNFVIWERPITAAYGKDDGNKIDISFKTQTMFLGPTFVGPLTTSLSVQTNDNNKTCQAEYSFLDKFTPSTADFSVTADFTPTPWPEF